MVETESAAEERAPWEVDRQLLGNPAQLGRRQLRGGDQEQRIREAAAAHWTACAQRGFGHPGGGRVDADDECARFAAGALDDRPAVAGPEVDDDTVGAGNPGGELADVHLVDASADDAAHGPESTLS
jgi:hypothetical protein